MGIESPSNPAERKTLAEISVIESSPTHIRSRAELKEYVEAPLLSASEIFFDKNIETIASSANAKDIQRGEVYIILNYGTLSPENKRIAESFAVHEQEGDLEVKIVIPVDGTTDVETIRRRAEHIAQQFVAQELNWLETHTFDEIKEIFAISSSDVTPEALAQEIDQYWDPDTKLFYPSEELFHKKKLSSQNNTQS